MALIRPHELARAGVTQLTAPGVASGATSGPVKEQVAMPEPVPQGDGYGYVHWADDVGTAFSGANGARIAEVAIWHVALSATELGDYCGGLAASAIQASNLIGYWPLSASSSTQSNLGVDATGDLTVTSATYDSDHQTIDSGLVKYLKVLAHSSMASATSLEGAVFSAPSGTDYVTGTTRYGDFTGQTAEASLESGQAVLKVLASTCGVDGLTVGATPHVLVRNATYTTGMIAGEIIED